MTERFTQHDTFEVERIYDAEPARVFAAWADPAAKSQWFGPPLKFDFRVGGVEVCVNPIPGGPTYTFESTYHEIVADKRIVYAYTMDEDSTRISVSLATVSFAPVDAGTRLTFVEQVVYLDIDDHAPLRRAGTNELMDQLGEYLAKER